MRSLNITGKILLNDFEAFFSTIFKAFFYNDLASFGDILRCVFLVDVN